MSNRIRAASAVILGCLIVVGVAACGGGGGSTSSESGSATSGSTSNPTDSNLSGKVVMWDELYESLPEYTEAVDQIISEFEKQHSGVEIEVVPQPRENVAAIYHSAFAAHQGPDMFMFGAGTSRTYAQGLEVLNERISPEMKSHLNLWEVSSKDLSPEGEIIGVPIGSIGYTFYYNKKMFKKAGLSTDFDPETWDELREAGEKLKAAGVEPWAAGNEEGAENLFYFSMELESESPEKVRELALGEIPWTDPMVANAFQPEIELQESGIYSPNRFTTSLFSEAWKDFAEEKGAMVIGFSVGAGFWGEFNPALGEKNVGRFLTPGKNFPVGVTPSLEPSIPKFSSNPDTAWAFIEYMSGKRGQEVLQTVGGFMSNRTDLGVPASFPSQPRAFLKETRERGVQAVPNTLMDGAITLEGGPLQTEMNEVLQGRTSLENAQKAMQEVAETVTP